MILAIFACPLGLMIKTMWPLSWQTGYKICQYEKSQSSLFIPSKRDSNFSRAKCTEQFLDKFCVIILCSAYMYGCYCIQKSNKYHFLI